MTFDKTLLALPLVALLAGGAWAQTDNSGGTGGTDAGTAAGTGDSAGGGSNGTAETDKGGDDATIGNQGPWAADIGNALFEEGYSGLRSMDDAKTRWTALSEEDKNVVRNDCERFSSEGASGRTAVVRSGMDPISSADMTSLCTMVGSF